MNQSITLMAKEYNMKLNSRFHRRRGFTIIELLVVITVVSLLLSLLLPALSLGRETAKVISCSSRQRQMGVALGAYASDYREYPTNFSDGETQFSWNTNDECAGRWYEESGNCGTATPNMTDAVAGAYGARGAWARLAGGNYVPYSVVGGVMTATGFNLCTSERQTANYYFMTGQWYQAGAGALFTYNGPHCYSACVANNGALNGLYLLGRHDVGAAWGVRYEGNQGFTPSQLGFLGCPSLYGYANPYSPISVEPHGTQPASAGAGQGDNGGITTQFNYDRNYLFADMHGSYLHSNGRTYVP